MALNQTTPHFSLKPNDPSINGSYWLKADLQPI